MAWRYTNDRWNELKIAPINRYRRMNRYFPQYAGHMIHPAVAEDGDLQSCDKAFFKHVIHFESIEGQQFLLLFYVEKYQE